jgi:hypothetical protein
MKTYRRLQLWIAIILIAYASLGSVIRSVRASREIFPIFSWELFAYVPNEGQEYGLKITAINNQLLDSPLYFEEAVQQWGVSDSVAATAFSHIQALGQAIVQGDAQRIQEARSNLETLYSGMGKNIRYEIIIRSFDVLEHWKTGRFTGEQRLEIFETSDNEQLYPGF